MREARGHFNLIHHETGFKADIYPVGQDKLHRWAMEKRRAVDFGQMKIWVAPPEYVILRKLEFFKEGGSEKHVRDIRGVLTFSSEIVDRNLLRAKAVDLGIVSELDQVLKLDH